LLQLSQPLRLVDLQPTVCLAPPVVGLLRYPKGFARGRNSLILAKENFSLAQLADDLFGCKGFLWHFSPVLPEYIQLS
jgi:hypothetical protein